MQQPTSLLKSLSKKELSTLTTTVNETLAVNCSFSEQKPFSTAELWNIPRNKRKSAGRRRFLV
jgi:hypothetical protein